MGCFSTSQTDGTEGSLQSLKSLLARKEAPIPSPCMAKKIIERKLGLGTRKTLQARTNLLDTACHNLAKAKQRTLVSFPPSFYITSDTAFFPLPLPPGYKPSTNSNSARITAKSTTIPANSVTTIISSSASNKRINVYNSKSSSTSTNSSDNIDVMASISSSSFSSNSSNSPCHSSSNSTTICHSSCEDLTPSSSTSSSLFSAAPSFLSQSSSFSSSTSMNNSDLRRNSLAHHIEIENSFLTPLPPPPPPPPRKLQALGSPLEEFSPLELAKACENFDDSYKIRDGSMGPFYKVFLPEQNSIVAIARVATEFSRRRWKAQIESLAQLVHPNVSKVIGFSYERAKYTMKGVEGMNVRLLNTGFIVYENESFGQESLKEFLQDVEKGHSHIDWLTRLHIALGIAKGLSFLLQNMPAHIDHTSLTMDNIRLDLSFNAKLLDFDLASSIDKSKERKSFDVVQAFGNVLLQLFDFISYPQGRKPQNTEIRSYPLNDAKLVIDLAASCLLTKPSLRPSIQHAARVLQSIELTHHVAKFPIKHSKSFGYRRKRSLSFG